MKIVAILLLFVLSGTYALYGQHFVPYSFLSAVNKGFRTEEGVPGKRYFQNRTDYRIDVRFDPRSGKLEGGANMVYYNNSPDSLKSLTFRLYQNLNKKGSARNETEDPAAINEGVKITMLNIAGEDLMQKFNTRTKTEGTLITVFLQKALHSLDSCSIHIEWNVVLPPYVLHRYGKYAEGSWFVAYWYPQIVVYDDLNGWDRLYPTGTQEFYNDFNTYEVSITVPSGYMVWATGEWENAGKVLHPAIYSRYMNAQQAVKTIHIITPDDLTGKKVFARRGSGTFLYQASQVPDFAFGVSDRYVWDGISVVTDSTGSERVFVSSAYQPGSKNFDQVAEAGAQAISDMCRHSYGLSYPYSHVTVFNGDGGMEFPMIVNDGALATFSGTQFVTMHEIAHAWFPFLAGINETKDGWMDEGLTTFLPMETGKVLGCEYHTLEHVIRQYDMLAGTDVDVPLFVSSWQTRDNAYLFTSYIRSVAAFSMLERYMGRDTFRLAIRNFVHHWAYRHPAPSDLFNLFKQSSNKDLDWFIDQWFYQPGWADLSIDSVSQTGSTLKIEIKKLGAFAVPVLLKINYKSGATDSVETNAGVWKDKNSLTVTWNLVDEPESIRLGDSTIPDKNRKDNLYEFPE
jgi:hypothetical protein